LDRGDGRGYREVKGQWENGRREERRVGREEKGEERVEMGVNKAERGEWREETAERRGKID